MPPERRLSTDARIGEARDTNAVYLPGPASFSQPMRGSAKPATNWVPLQRRAVPGLSTDARIGEARDGKDAGVNITWDDLSTDARIGEARDGKDAGVNITWDDLSTDARIGEARDSAMVIGKDPKADSQPMRGSAKPATEKLAC